MQEYFHNNDEKEALECTYEKFHSSTIALFVEAAVLEVLEGKSSQRSQLGSFLALLVRNGALVSDQFAQGVNSVLEYANDLLVDIPKMWDFLAEVLAVPLAKCDVSLAFLLKTGRFLLNREGDGFAAKYALAVVKKTVALMKESEGISDPEKKLGEMWDKAGLGWNLFLAPSANAAEFAKQNVSFLH